MLRIDLMKSMLMVVLRMIHLLHGGSTKNTFSFSAMQGNRYIPGWLSHQLSVHLLSASHIIWLKLSHSLRHIVFPYILFGVISQRIEVQISFFASSTQLSRCYLPCRYGDEHKLAGFSATLQAIMSFVENRYELNGFFNPEARVWIL